MTKEPPCCDHCGCIKPLLVALGECPYDTDSTNKGESAHLCLDCINILDNTNAKK